MSKTHRQNPRRAAWLLLLALLLWGGAELGRAVGADVAGQQLRAQAQRRGWSLHWEQLQVGYDLSLSLRGVRARDAHGSSLELRQATAGLDWAALRQGRPRPGWIKAQGARGDLDLASLSGAGDQEPRPTQQGGRAGAAARAPGPLPRIQLKDSALRLRGLPALETVSLSSLSLEGRPGEQGWRGTLVARCLEGCGQPQWLRGQMEHQGETLRASVALDHPVQIQADVPGQEPIPLEVRRVSMALDKEGLRLGVGDLSMPARVQRWRGDLRLREVQARFDSLDALKQRRPAAVELHQPTLTLTREANQGSPEGSPAPPDPVALLGAARGALDKLAARLEAAPRVEVHQGQLRVPQEGLHLTDIQAHSQGRALELSATWLGAKVKLEARGAQQPLRLRWEALPLSSLRALPRLPDPARHLKALRRLDGLTSGDLALTLEPERVRVEGRLALERGLLEIEGLSERPIEDQDLEVALQASWLPGQAGAPLLLEEVTLRAPSRVEGPWASLHLRGRVEHLLEPGRALAFQVDLHLPEGPCDQAVGAIPAALLHHLQGQLKVEGRFAPHLSAALDLADPRGLKLELEGFPGTCHVASLGEYSPDYLAQRFTQRVREGVSRDDIEVGPGTRHYTRLRNIPKHTRMATYLTEDVQFYDNGGLSLNLIRRAVMLNLEKGRYVYGGSTISQQLVKNLFLTRKKTLGRKLEEAFIVWRMEELLTKDRILELYLNCIEFGPDVYGIGQASRHYFHKPPSKLTALEGAFLAALKPAPWQGGWFKRAGKSPGDGFWRERMDRIMKRLARFEAITPAELQAAGPDYVVSFPKGG